MGPSLLTPFVEIKNEIILLVLLTFVNPSM